MAVDSLARVRTGAAIEASTITDLAMGRQHASAVFGLTDSDLSAAEIAVAVWPFVALVGGAWFGRVKLHADAARGFRSGASAAASNGTAKDDDHWEAVAESNIADPAMSDLAAYVRDTRRRHQAKKPSQNGHTNSASTSEPVPPRVEAPTIRRRALVASVIGLLVAWAVSALPFTFCDGGAEPVALRTARTLGAAASRVEWQHFIADAP